MRHHMAALSDLLAVMQFAPRKGDAVAPVNLMPYRIDITSH
jgi:hypothetical protein